MVHFVAIALTALWVAGNFYLWSLQQPAEALLWQSLVMALIAYPNFYWYVGRS